MHALLVGESPVRGKLTLTARTAAAVSGPKHSGHGARDGGRAGCVGVDANGLRPQAERFPRNRCDPMGLKESSDACRSGSGVGDERAAFATGNERTVFVVATIG